MFLKCLAQADWAERSKNPAGFYACTFKNSIRDEAAFFLGISLSESKSLPAGKVLRSPSSGSATFRQTYTRDEELKQKAAMRAHRGFLF